MQQNTDANRKKNKTVKLLLNYIVVQLLRSRRILKEKILDRERLASVRLSHDALMTFLQNEKASLSMEMYNRLLVLLRLEEWEHGLLLEAFQKGYSIADEETAERLLSYKQTPQARPRSGKNPTILELNMNNVRCFSEAVIVLQEILMISDADFMKMTGINAATLKQYKEGLNVPGENTVRGMVRKLCLSGLPKQIFLEQAGGDFRKKNARVGLPKPRPVEELIVKPPEPVAKAAAKPISPKAGPETIPLPKVAADASVVAEADLSVGPLPEGNGDVAGAVSKGEDLSSVEGGLETSANLQKEKRTRKPREPKAKQNGNGCRNPEEAREVAVALIHELKNGRSTIDTVSRKTGITVEELLKMQEGQAPTLSHMILMIDAQNWTANAKMKLVRGLADRIY